jgi:DAK2 domain fusion protein YloV
MIIGSQLRDALISGANCIANHRAEVDELNIFPVPDGDTGTNMSMTIGAAQQELVKLDDQATAAVVAKTNASALLRGARGNSGVILSILFRGFSKGLEGKDEADAESLVSALEMGVEAAYKAVMKPTEGTILTVARLASVAGRQALELTADPVEIWDAICTGAADALATTPDLLPVLKKAGVVDAGGKGLCLIFEGMQSVFRDGVIVETKAEAQLSSEEAFRNAAAEFDEVINFTYCTEFIVGRDTEIEKEPAELRAYLETIGDCVLVVDDDDIIKVHVHTENPGNALQAGLGFGSLLTVKIENMKEQHRKNSEANDAKKAEAPVEEAAPQRPEPVDPEEGVGFVAVAAGEGLHALFSDLGCAQVVSGGQTMNPSTNDIVDAIRAVPATTVFVLPNNKNIVMAAQQAIDICTERKVIVLPTRTIPQGMSAMLAYDPDSDDETNTELMLEAAGNVSTGQVTFAARDSDFGGFKIKEGDMLAMDNGKLVFTEKEDPVKTAYRLVRSMASRDTAFVTIIYGEDITEEQAQKLSDMLESRMGGDVEITLINGGQPVYYFIMSVE